MEQNTWTDKVWHPYTQMKDTSLINVVKGEGSYLYDEKGNRYIDAVASWWTNIHGHAHPFIAQRIYEQALQLEHVIFAGFTHPAAEELATKLLQRIPSHSRIFYSDNGSTAVELALKMALQYFGNKGENRSNIIAFKDAYHGDTFGSMSVSGRGVFTAPYENLLFDVHFITTPVKGSEDKANRELKELLQRESGSIAAFIFEPLVLGSGGMIMYDAEVLDELIAICRQNNVLTIADEVMTGFGRTGKFLATDYCYNGPDIICLSKGITGGFMPFAATTCKEEIYQAFLSDEKQKMLFHGHSYTANPLGCAAAIASLEVFEKEKTLEKVEHIDKQHLKFLQQVGSHKKIKDARCRGTILAIEIATENETGYLNQIRDKAYNFFLERRIILRPLGNVIYILPPYCISDTDLKEVYSAIKAFLDSL